MMDKTSFERYNIPEHMQEALLKYVQHRIRPGDFLMAVLRNNLRGALEQAGSTNIHLLPVYVAFLYNEAPAMCWGSAEKVEKWLYGE